jgi:hypothetical protein
VFELDDAEPVGPDGVKELVVLMFPFVETADEGSKGPELPAVGELLTLYELELKTPGELLVGELNPGELVAPPFEVTLGLVSDTTEPLLLDSGAVGTRLPELDEEWNEERVLLP